MSEKIVKKLEDGSFSITTKEQTKEVKDETKGEVGEAKASQPKEDWSGYVLESMGSGRFAFYAEKYDPQLKNLQPRKLLEKPRG